MECTRWQFTVVMAAGLGALPLAHHAGARNHSTSTLKISKFNSEINSFTDNLLLRCSLGLFGLVFRVGHDVSIGNRW